MNYSTVNFMEVRTLVLQQELEPDPQMRLDDPALFRASNEVNRAKLAICNLRERAMKVYQILSIAPHSGQQLLHHFEDKGSIWFDESLSSDLLCMVPIAVARCPDLLFPEILVHAVITTKNAGPFLKACFMVTPILKRECIELLADFIFKWTQVTNVGIFCEQSDPLLLYCLQQCCSAMESICQSDSHIALILREALVRRRICASMIFQITVEVLKDAVDFMARVLFASNEICQWIVSCIRSRKKGIESCSSIAETEKFPKFSELRNLLQLSEGTVLQLCQALHIGAKAAFHEHGWSSYLYCHLKLYCVLVNLGGLQPIHDEVIFWLRALTCTVESSGDNVKSSTIKCLISKQRFELGVTFLFLVPALHGSSLIDNLFRECILFFLGPATSNLMHFEQGSELALWLVVQLLSQCYARVFEYCSKAIGMKIKIASTCWEDVCRIAYETRITSDIESIAKAASALQPGRPIASTEADQWVIECLFQLLKLGHFARYGVDITQSIMNCILLSVEPVHPIVVQMIEIFAKASSTPTPINCTDVYEIKPLPYSFLASVIKPFSSHFTVLESVLEEETGEVTLLRESKSGRSSLSDFTITDSAVHAVLASYYVLCREHFQREQESFGNCKNSLNGTNGKGSSWPMILRSLPLVKLLVHMESRQHLYEHIFAQWVGLAVSILPEQLPVSHLMQRLEPQGESIAKEEPEFEEHPEFKEQIGMHNQELKHVGQNSENEEGMGPFSIQLAHQVLRNSLVDCLPALQLLNAIHACNVPAKDKLELQIVVVEDMIPLLLDMSCSVSLQEAFCQWWYGLDQASVEFLIPTFCRCISSSDVEFDKRSSSSINEVELLSASDFYQELVEQPFSILSCRTEIYHTPLISIFLDILKELLFRNRQMCLMASKNDGLMKKEGLRAVDTRDSAVCQILLENWSKMSSIGVPEDMVQKAGSSICAFISSLFYSSPSIFRIVHFQGYDMKLIPAVVEGINMMVHFLEYFEDSLHMVELSLLPFMMVVLSNVIRRHPYHSRSLSAAQKAVMHIKSMDSVTVINFLVETLEPLSWLAITFSLLEPEVRDFLEECSRAMNLGEMSAGPRVEEFHSLLISALALLNEHCVDGD